MDIDTPETVYECPVCQEGLELKRMDQHIARHLKLHKHLITTEERQLIYGLLDVVRDVMDDPKHNSGAKQDRAVRRKKYFTHYWTNATWKREAARDEVLEHTAGNLFRKKGVGPGDEVYIITVIDGKIMLGGKILVEKIVGQKEAARIFGVEPRDIWEAREHIIGGDEYAYDFTPEKEVPWDIAKIVTVINSDGERGLKRTGDGRGIDSQTIRGVCEINERSARRFDGLL